MKDYLKLFVFISIVALITSFAFVSMDLLFSARIEQNQNESYYRAVLVHNEVAFTEDNLFEVFEETITTETYTYDGMEVRVFVNQANNNVSFIFGLFEKAGLWGDIIGVMTVNQAFTEVVNVSVLVNEEQLGKDVSQRYYLDQFIGTNVSLLESSKALYDEIDHLTGATNTSYALQEILLESYNIYKNLLGIEA
jgi:Na+-translocating ferredoxin:NAD+ oxidoreductase RnfG subunit